MTTQHTPTPWQHGEGICEHKIYSITRPELDEIARCYGDSAKEAHDNAAFIVRACNAHEGLIEALERIAWHELTWKESRDVARAALAATEIK